MVRRPQDLHLRLKNRKIEIKFLNLIINKYFNSFKPKVEYEDNKNHVAKISRPTFEATGSKK